MARGQREMLKKVGLDLLRYKNHVGAHCLHNKPKYNSLTMMMRICIFLLSLLSLVAEAGEQGHFPQDHGVLQSSYKEVDGLFAGEELLLIMDIRKAFNGNPKSENFEYNFKYNSKILPRLQYYASNQFHQKLNFLDFAKTSLIELNLPRDWLFEDVYDRISAAYTGFYEYSSMSSPRVLQLQLNDKPENSEKGPESLQIQALAKHLKIEELVELCLERFKLKFKAILERRLTPF